MPELPDVTVYVEALTARIVGHTLRRVAIRGPFLLRSVSPPVEAVQGKTVRQVRRVGKRIAIGLEDDLWLVLHLMIAGRLHWRESAPKLAARGPLAVFQFDSGTLTLTEAGTQHRAALHVVAGEDVYKRQPKWCGSAPGLFIFAARWMGGCRPRARRNLSRTR